ncbi:hypothetical protein IFM89_027625 [Coptis chinensis]|uniref:Uncharacterized protein n=1 Tax=Coptis chinensis TaxID=261450 RepID=A0A835IQ85_9MAGN|nr:hypothetical protein IFM89_027625 [Coptis chinensis]
MDCSFVPKAHSSHFHELNNNEAVDLGGILKLMLLKLSRQLNDPPYNFMIHSSPFKVDASQLPYAHWFLQIVPQLSGVGGFEIGSGCYINLVFPGDAAKELKGNVRVFCRVRPMLPDDGASAEASVICYPTSMESLGRGIDLLQNGNLGIDKSGLTAVQLHCMFIEWGLIVIETFERLSKSGSTGDRLKETQVVDEKCVSKDSKPKKKSAKEILV